MESEISLGVVVPAYGSGLALWRGIRDLHGYRHPSVTHLHVIIVDDGSTRCGFKEGLIGSSHSTFEFLANKRNIGQSRTTFRGYRRADTDWVAFLEDDLLDWPMALNLIVDSLLPGIDLVSVARPSILSDSRSVRSLIQPFVRHVLKPSSGGHLDDPTSPIKAVKRNAFGASDMECWADYFHEGAICLARNPREIVGEGLEWDRRPSRYSPTRRVALALGLLSRVLQFRLAARKIQIG